MKKKFLILSLFCSLMVNAYLFNKLDKADDFEVISTVKDSSSAPKVDKVELAQASIEKIKLKSSLQTKTTPQEVISSPTLYTGLPSEADLVKAEESWRSSVSEFFIQDLELGEIESDKYFELKEARNRELSEFLNEKIKAQGSYIFTLEDMVEENKINKKYLDELKSLMGEDGYSAYKKFRNAHNQKLIESQNMHFMIEL